jgi:hypothetical protein
MKKAVAVIVAVIVLLVGGTAVVLALANRDLPKQSAVVSQLSELEKARLAEAIQLRRRLGAQVWPGWEQADIPIVLYNEQYAFLIGYDQPPTGWRVPDGEQRGTEWELVDDLLAGESYYRQQLPASGETPQAFTVRVGERWAASMTTKEWMEIKLMDMFREQLPELITAVFPYEWMSQQFIGGTEGYVGALLHESFHAFIGDQKPERLAAAEAVLSVGDQFPWSDEGFEAAWQTELDLLIEAVEADSVAEMADLARQFLQQRDHRRTTYGLNEELIDYEQQREWLEGIAKYVEMEIQRQAWLTEEYDSVTAVATDPNFNAYANLPRRWQQQVDQIGRMAGDEGDGRFYYTGMAQAFLLDQLLPDWKTMALDEGVYLEDLLAIAINNNS